MTGTSALFLLQAINVIVYVTFVLKRGEGSLFWTLALALLLGPLVWFVWIAQRAGRLKAARES
ncbi:MAG: hypothetical protein JWP14_2058 [Frankiales bacterium]|nr:hypothetical protein [Frankiales bacterium]